MRFETGSRDAEWRLQLVWVEIQMLAEPAGKLLVELIHNEDYAKGLRHGDPKYNALRLWRFLSITSFSQSVDGVR